MAPQMFCPFFPMVGYICNFYWFLMHAFCSASQGVVSVVVVVVGTSHQAMNFTRKPPTQAQTPSCVLRCGSFVLLYVSIVPPLVFPTIVRVCGWVWILMLVAEKQTNMSQSRELAANPPSSWRCHCHRSTW